MKSIGAIGFLVDKFGRFTVGDSMQTIYTTPIKSYIVQTIVMSRSTLTAVVINAQIENKR